MDSIYVLELPNGRVKVGQSSDVEGRLRAHRQTLNVVGEPLRQVWSAPVSNGREAERQVLAALRSAGARPVAGGEVFDGVSFMFAIMVAYGVCGVFGPSVQRSPDPDHRDEIVGAYERELLDDLLVCAAGLPGDRLPASGAVAHLRSLGRSRYLSLDAAQLAATLRRLGVGPRKMRSPASGGRAISHYSVESLESARRNFTQSDVRARPLAPPNAPERSDETAGRGPEHSPNNDLESPNTGPAGTR